MAVDAEGFIRRLPAVAMQGEFRPLLDDACFRLASEAGSLLDSVYVYGSVATGQAIPYRSDLDLSLVLRKRPSQSELGALEAIRTGLEADYAVVSKIDFDIGCLEDMSSGESGLGWRYWLKHHCRCILGVDLAENISPFRPAKNIAWAVNGDFHAVLSDYIMRISTADALGTTQRLQREAARKAIRSTNILRCETDTDWPETLDEHAMRFCGRYPDRADDMHFLMAQAVAPTATAAAFVARLDGFIGWMDSASRLEA